MARRHRRPCASVIAALAALGLVVHPGSALHKGPRSARTAPPPRPAREWSGRLRERLKRENLDLRGGVDAFWRAGTEGADSLEPQKSFALGPRSAAALQSDLEYSRKILERALSAPLGTRSFGRSVFRSSGRPLVRPLVRLASSR